MAAVVPAWKLQELLDIDKFVNLRQAEDEEVQQRNQQSTVQLDVVVDAMANVGQENA